ncbi:ATP dependent DNA ligase [Thioalkalivibrio nitratireducens DSM 14787]|uniref:ATP dependent DNA ligase n=1 Tax=Thioalkalivibrio nitratireducens (strain DSM 14787 / UNIQEM 213 / ALEN2) TaxID=1255043 RepID=L0DZZ5_THIND|nr:RNA ligase [Thioalkalivibrio nitratireducens]AGA34530.1 ATP dependent DNA ligase [Thioalkalivibrio nitratireducens DSM 14787]
MDGPTLADAIDAGRAERLCFEGLEYARLTETVAGYPRGSVVLPGGVVIPGYPSIGRVHSLSAGLREQFDGPFWAEEKIDGFNVRILRHEGAVLAFSRGGFVCPFSTDRLHDFIDPALFEIEPDLVLCAEIAGPENPYLEGSPPFVTEDIALYVFDMMRQGRGSFLGQQEKMGLIASHGLPPTRTFGRFEPHDVDPLRDLIFQLDAEGAEGLVLKGEWGGKRAKYVTGRSNVTDIRVCSEQLLDLPPEYFINRLTRLAIFVTEHGQQGDPELERSLGHAFLSGLDRAVERSRSRGRVDHRYRCRFRERRNALHFMDHMAATGGHRVRMAPGMPVQQDGYWILEFERVFDRMTGTLATALSGAVQYD